MSSQSIEDACLQACQLLGVEYKSVASDGEFHRTDLTDDAHGKNDAGIKIFPDRLGGIIWNHKSGDQRVFFVNDSRDGGQSISPAERERIQQEQQRRKAEQQTRQNKATLKALAIWQQANTSPEDHPYLIRKQVKPHALRVGTWTRTIKDDQGKRHLITIDNALIVPMYNQAGLIRSLQAIFPEKNQVLDRDKDFLPGGGLAGLFSWVGPKTDKVLIAEGFATAATLHEDTGYRVYIAFTANNLLTVGRIVREKLPDAEIVFCADNDTKTPGNPGLTKATEAAQAVGGSVTVPPMGSDFNDYAIYLKGLNDDPEG